MNFLKLLTHILPMTTQFHTSSLFLLKLLPPLESYFSPFKFQTCDRVIYTCHFHFLFSNFQFKNKHPCFCLSNLLIQFSGRLPIILWINPEVFLNLFVCFTLLLMSWMYFVILIQVYFLITFSFFIFHYTFLFPITYISLYPSYFC